VGLVERLEHAVHRPGQLAHLVLGLGDRDALGGIAGAADPAGQPRECLDRAHCSIGNGEAGEQSEQGAADDTGA